MFEPYTRSLRALRVELDAFGELLQPATPLGEANHILPLVRRSRHLAAAFGFANHALGAPDLLAVERPLLGSFRCDVAVGSSTVRQFTLIELEDARENSIFEAVKGRDYPRWSSRFERGFSQLIDWAWRIDHERQPSATLEALFGTADPRTHYLLVIGRNHWIGAAGRARLEWSAQWHFGATDDHLDLRRSILFHQRQVEAGRTGCGGFSPVGTGGQGPLNNPRRPAEALRNHESQEQCDSVAVRQARNGVRKNEIMNGMAESLTRGAAIRKYGRAATSASIVASGPASSDTHVFNSRTRLGMG